jgi:hypothetical protein
LRPHSDTLQSECKPFITARAVDVRDAPEVARSGRTLKDLCHEKLCNLGAVKDRVETGKPVESGMQVYEQSRRLHVFDMPQPLVVSPWTS